MSGGRVLFFDFDGTLIDSMGQHAVIFGELLHDAFGVDAATAGQDYLTFAGAPLEAQFRHALDNAGVDWGPRSADLILEFWRRYGELKPVLFPEVADVLERLTQTHRLVVTTQGNQQMVEHKLADLDVARHFDLILGVDPARPEIGKGPAHFRLASEALHLAPEELRTAVLTGDGAFDMRVAREAGMTAVGRLTNANAEALFAAGAHHVVRDLTELEALLEKGA
jgi:phosphoglycolate phosphatase-like HAD superfamily hydrolase